MGRDVVVELDDKEISKATAAWCLPGYPEAEVAIAQLSGVQSLLSCY